MLYESVILNVPCISYFYNKLCSHTFKVSKKPFGSQEWKQMYMIIRKINFKNKSRPEKQPERIRERGTDRRGGQFKKEH